MDVEVKQECEFGENVTEQEQRATITRHKNRMTRKGTFLCQII